MPTLMIPVVVQTDVIFVLLLTTYMRNFAVAGKLIAFVLYYIKEKTVASIKTVGTVTNSIISCKFFLDC